MSAAPTAKTKSAATAADEIPAPATAPARRRRVPGWLLAAVGIALAITYGVVVEHMRMGPPLVMLGLGGMTLVLAGLALWRVIDPLMRAEPPPALASRAPQRLRELEREKQIVLKAIKEIELDYQMRKIAEGDYRDMIGRYRARAMRLISELEAGDNFRQLIERELKDRLRALAEAGVEAPAPAVTPALPAPIAAEQKSAVAPTPAPASGGPACAACGTTNDSDAQFCKTCGVRLAPSS